jgi:hypothetical protein
MKLLGSKVGFVAMLLGAALASPSARADEPLDDAESAPSVDDGAPAPSMHELAKVEAARGTFLPLSQAGVVGERRAFVTGLGGYDGARKTGTFEALTEVHLWGPIALRGGAVYTNAGRSLKPSVGARIGLLREGRHGLDGAFGVFYKPEGLTEPEGEVEGVLSLGRHVGATYLVANLAYGQDPEGNERDGEARVAGVRPVSRILFVGLDSRVRFDLGSNAMKLAAHNEPTFDLLAGPLAQLVLGPVALSLQGGASSVRLAGHTANGAFVLTGLGVAL